MGITKRIRGELEGPRRMVPPFKCEHLERGFPRANPWINPWLVEKVSSNHSGVSWRTKHFQQPRVYPLVGNVWFARIPHFGWGFPYW